MQLTKTATTALSSVPTSRIPSRLDRFSAITVLVAFGLTWPVLELLGDNAEFFIARGSEVGEMIGLAVLLTLVIPAFVGLLGVIPGRFGSLVANVAIWLFSSALAHLYLRRTPLTWWGAVVLATVIGLAVVWGFNKFGTAHRFARYLLPAPLVLLLFFVFSTPAGAVLTDRGSDVGVATPVGNPLPVVMLVLDEFPVAALIDPEGNLRDDRYPGFARLAEDATWFRNAVTVEQQTEHSVPAIITGTVPDQSLTPFSGQYPNTLFTALDGAYDLEVNETITQLCPIRVCERAAVSRPAIAKDVLIVAGHVLMPVPLTESLPPIDGTWGDFDAASNDFDAVAEFQRNLGTDRRRTVNGLLEEITEYDGGAPPFYFLHALVPHHPWEYLPDGRRYPLVVARNPGSFRGGWIDDDFLVAQGMQRHLLQVGYADHVISELISTLEAAGLYDEAIVVVVADHGISIKPGVGHQRTITPTTVGEVAAIPLFIKGPGLEGGLIDDRRALTIDIVATIADMIDANLGWPVDGVSLLAPPPRRSETTTIGPKGEVTYGIDGMEKLETAARIEEWFPNGDPWALVPSGSPNLIGDSINPSLLQPSPISVRLRQPELYEHVDADGDLIPVRIAGRLDEGDGSEILAISVNGVVGAVTRSYVIDEQVWFLAMVPPSLLRDGANEIDVLQVGPDGELLRVDEG